MSFSAAIYNAIKIKAFIETLFQNISELNLIIDNDGIKSFTISSHSTEFYVNLPARLFDEYSFTFPFKKSIILERYILKALQYVKNKTTVRFSMAQPYTFEVTITHLDNINLTTTITTQDTQITEEKILYTPVTKPICITGSKFNYICKAVKSSILVISKLIISLFFQVE